MSKVKVLTVIFILIITNLMSFIILWLIAGRWVSPAKRTLQDYHQEWLRSPAAHGLKIQAFSALQGKVPCLLTEPDASAGVGKRGKQLREQLINRKQVLEAYGTVTGIIVLLHGRKGRKEDLLPVAERFAVAGFRCLIPDLPAHGDSPITTLKFATDHFESHLPAAILAETRQRFNLPNEPAALWGLSMGSAYAVKAAAESPGLWQALVIVSSFDSLTGVLDDQLNSWFMSFISPIRSLIETLVVLRGGVKANEVQPAVWASQINIPVLVIHGDEDKLINIERGKALWNAFASTHKRWIAVTGGDHYRVLVTPMPLYATITEWFLDNMQQ